MSDIAASNHEPIAVVGLWHLGSVTAACLAEAGHEVLGVDPDEALAAGLAAGEPPVAEPGLAELIAAHSASLRFTSDERATAGMRRAWVTFDTPVDENDVADVEWVLDRAARALEPLAEGALVIVSSQLPVGSVAELENRCASRRGARDLRFVCIPENLRLGDSLDSLRNAERFVVGVREQGDRAEVAALLAGFGGEIVWMRVESAEMTKHALNGFLATSVAFINEVAAVCEAVGADAGEVSRGLKSERRIGPRAYLGPGDAFAGGTLARDIGFLRGLAAENDLDGAVFAGVAAGNDAHKDWARRKLNELVGELPGLTIAIWGLTYKPGTDTLRRSAAVELALRLRAQGAVVRAHDPALTRLPDALAGEIVLCDTPLAAAERAAALVLCTPWPVYREVDPAALAGALEGRDVIDAPGFLAERLGADPAFRYARVGTPLAPRAPAGTGARR